MSDSSSRRPPPPPQHPSSADDVTWLDFLRTAGGTVPADGNASSGDRKRRHAGSSPERRGHPYSAFGPNAAMTGRRPSGMSMNSQTGGIRHNAIDLTTPPSQPGYQRPQVPSRTFEELMATRPAPRYGGAGGSVRGSMMPSRRESDIILPQWQPDSEVSKCPVCQTDFHFFYRKHHCRKCGRVVCAACSPHRITIPKQYIVQPPNSDDGEQEPPSPVSGGNWNRGLGGGEVVRVCNPCVPDPWTPNQISDEQSRPRPVGAGPDRELSAIAERYRLPNNESAAAGYQRNAALTDAGGGRRVSMNGFVQSEYERQRQRNVDHARALRDSMDAGRARSQSVQQHSNRQYPPPVFALRDPRNYSHAPQPPPPNIRPQGHRNTHSGASASFPAMPPGQMPQPVPPPPVPHVQPRREVREEDECPVCGMELPPGEDVREAHIQECINLRFSATPSSSSLPNPPASAPPPRTSSISMTRPPHPDAPATTADASTPTGSRPRATSYRPRGMAVYKATEKDCTNEEGETQECVICFEEFQPGDEMGRMECLCKFHRLCIRQWWDTKGTGSCPTHQLHD